MNKAEKKAKISKFIDLANGRFKDDEVDLLFDMVNNPKNYNGRSKSIHNSFDGWCSDGKYHRDEKTTYTLRCDNNQVFVQQDYVADDDDGYHKEYSHKLTTAREILGKLGLLR